MARPRGYTLSRQALEAILTARRLTLTEAAEHCSMPLTTLSGLAQRNHRASLPTVRQIEDGLGIDGAALFPELAGFGAPDEVRAVA